MPQTPEEAIKRGFIRAPDHQNLYHRNKGQIMNVKYYHPQTGQEVFFDYQGKVVTDPANIGTKNYGSDPDTLSHVWNDVLPYYIWGNSSNDTTPFEDRVLGPEIGLSIRFSLEEIQKVFYNILKKIPANL